MAGLTLEQAEAKLTAYLEAETAVLAGVKFRTPDGRELTRANLPEIQDGIKIWNARCQSLARVGGLPVREVIPR